MPLFMYECQTCHAEVEILVRGSEVPECPACASKKLTKLVSAITPMAGSGSSRASAEPMSCGKPSCCRMQGGCGNN